jgi:hypothetical protein
MVPLADLSDQARIRLFPADPPLDDAGTQALRAMFDKLFAQFAKEGRVKNWAVDTDAGGVVLIVAHDGGDDDLSGCSKDKIAKALLHAEKAGFNRFLSAPPIVIEADGRARCCDRAGLRKLMGDGSINQDSVLWNLRAETLGDWRHGNRVKLRDSWLAQLVALPL